MRLDHAMRSLSRSELDAEIAHLVRPTYSAFLPTYRTSLDVPRDPIGQRCSGVIVDDPPLPSLPEMYSPVCIEVTVRVERGRVIKVNHLGTSTRIPVPDLSDRSARSMFEMAYASDRVQEETNRMAERARECLRDTIAEVCVESAARRRG
jgi:hypothetical protein